MGTLDQSPGEPLEAQAFSALAQSRRTVRDFTTRPIPPETLDAILDDARHVASWSNTRPYLLAVASGEQADRLREAYVEKYQESGPLRRKERGAFLRAGVAKALGLQGRPGVVPLPDGDFPTWKPYPEELKARSRKVGVGLYQHLGIERDDLQGREAHGLANCEFFGAPTVLFVFAHKELLPFSAHDAGLMTQTLMLAAKARGVDSCPLGILATWRGPVDAEFEIPPDYQLLTGLALGYASDHHVNDFRAEHPQIELAPSRPRTDSGQVDGSRGDEGGYQHPPQVCVA